MSNAKRHKPLADTELGSLAALFRMLGEEMRLRILQAVCYEPRTVSEIVEATGSTQANVSKHLSLLASAGILTRRKSGIFVYYAMKDPLVMQLCGMVRTRR
jgi:DNA-binding transcriptional ArsR family regulator